MAEGEVSSITISQSKIANLDEGTSSVEDWASQFGGMNKI